MRFLRAAGAGILIAVFLAAPAQAAPTLTATLAPKHLVSAPITATATLTEFTVAGRIFFRRYTNGSCTGSYTTVGSPMNVFNGTYSAASQPPVPDLQTGTPGGYSLIVFFDANQGSPGADRFSACLPFLIQNPVTVGMQLSKNSFEIGERVEPQLTLEGMTPDAGGQVEVARWSGSGCGAGEAVSAGILPVANGLISGTVTVHGSGLGVRSLRANYSGDTKNTEAASVCREYTVGARIRGSVFVDIDGNGVRDGAEVGIVGVKITLKRPAGGISDVTTAADGLYEFLVTSSGSYSLTQTQPEGYSSTTVDELTVSVSAASVSGQDFGESLAPSLGAVPTSTPDLLGPTDDPIAVPQSGGGDFAVLRLIALALVIIAALTMLVLIFHARWRREDDFY